MENDLKTVVKNLREQIDEYIEKKVEDEMKKYQPEEREMSEKELEETLEVFEDEFSIESQGNPFPNERLDSNRSNSSEEPVQTIDMTVSSNKARYNFNDSTLAVMATCQMHEEDPETDHSLSFRELERKCGWSNSAISRAYYQLEEAGWITRQEKQEGYRRPIVFHKKLENPHHIFKKYSKNE